MKYVFPGLHVDLDRKRVAILTPLTRLYGDDVVIVPSSREIFHNFIPNLEVLLTKVRDADCTVLTTEVSTKELL